jgi:hypothetical protein
MAFTRKRIDVSISLANGNFSGGGNTYNAKGNRVTALIHKPGGGDMGTLDCGIYGLPLSVMNQLTTLGTQSTLINQNTITLKAYEEGQQPAMVFKGTISSAFADMRGMPAACLRVQALAGLLEAVKPVEPTSVKGSADVGQTMGQIAKKAGLQFENSGVNVKIANPYLWGAAGLQALHLAEAAGIEHIIDNGTLAIWPRDKPRQGDASTVQPPQMIGYPAYTQAGLEVTTLFDPTIKYGGSVTVKSDLKPACGKWVIIDLNYNLEAEVPRGRWECTLTLNRPISGQGQGPDPA